MLRPRFIAEQARNAKGMTGRLIAFIMARETWTENRRAIDALAVGPEDHVLDVGCAHGRSLPALAALATAGGVVGTDPSALMVSIATKRSRKLVRTGSVRVVAARADALPFSAATFDKALCVHVVYFWHDPGAALREVARVLKPGGRLALVFRTESNDAAGAFPRDVYRFPRLGEMASALEAAGFSVDLPADATELERSAPLLLIAIRKGAQP